MYKKYSSMSHFVEEEYKDIYKDIMSYKSGNMFRQ